jgi:Domain of unknown function (DUF4386)/UvrD-like helicase C-terminal domain
VRLNEGIRSGNVPDELVQATVSKIVLSTIHRSKGLEFPSVMISDPVDAGEGPDDSDIAEEARILYVAMTRAKRSLERLNGPNGCRAGKDKNDRCRLYTYRNGFALVNSIEIRGGDCQALDPAGAFGFDGDVEAIQAYLRNSISKTPRIEMFRPVNRSLSLVAALFSLVGCGVQAFAFVFYLAPLVAMGGAQYLSVFKVEQLQAVGLMFLKLYGQAYNIGLVFFGFYCFLIGCLIVRSTFLPRTLGVLMVCAGLGWLTFLYPPFADYLRPYILLPGIIGEGSLTLWLLVKGVNDQGWKAQASAAGSSKG